VNEADPDPATCPLNTIGADGGTASGTLIARFKTFVSALLAVIVNLYRLNPDTVTKALIE